MRINTLFASASTPVFKMKVVCQIFVFVVVLILYLSCRKDNAIVISPTDFDVINSALALPQQPFNYANPNFPKHFNSNFITIQNNTPANNLVTDWGATLGRVLFYDKRLSKNNVVSCSSCHLQQFGFTDTAQFSKGFEGGLTHRHSMSLINSVFYINGRFFWDERAATLEEQVLQPIQDSVEMGMRLDALEQKLRVVNYYPILFKLAFGDTSISSTKLARALAQFVRSMVSYQSKYDTGLASAANRNSDFSNFTPEENLGKRIFITNLNVNCFGCHNTDAFIMDNPRNNGLSINNNDDGIFIHTANVFDKGKFKAPSLRNVALRMKYMHNGSIVGLNGVLAHYNDGIQVNSNLDPHLKDVSGNPERMNLTSIEMNALKAFLETLTDNAIITDSKFSSPFK